MRYSLDEDISPQVAEIARALGLDVITSHECGRNGLLDDEQLQLAAADERCFVTRNRNDFIQLTIDFLEAAQPHTGVLIVSRTLANDGAAAIAQALLAHEQSHEAGLSSYGIDFLSRPAPYGSI